MISKVLHLVLICVATGLLGQERVSDPVPIWPGHESLPEHSDKYVFLTQDRHTIIVRLPSEDNTKASSPRVIRIPIHNNLKPIIETEISQGLDSRYTYKYSVANSPDVTDAIGVLSIIAPVEDSAIFVRPSATGECWAGSPAFAKVAKQPLFPDAPIGRFLIWVRQKNREILPGHSLDCFLVQSSYKPGLTTAWAGSAELPSFDQNWPSEVFKQLDLLEDRRWREKHALVVGPMFAPGSSRAEIVAVLIRELNALKQNGVIDPESPFMRDVLGILARLRDSKRTDETLNIRYATTLERNVAIILRYSLDVHVSSLE